MVDEASIHTKLSARSVLGARQSHPIVMSNTPYRDDLVRVNPREAARPQGRKRLWMFSTPSPDPPVKRIRKHPLSQSITPADCDQHDTPTPCTEKVTCSIDRSLLRSPCSTLGSRLAQTPWTGPTRRPSTKVSSEAPFGGIIRYPDSQRITRLLEQVRDRNISVLDRPLQDSPDIVRVQFAFLAAVLLRIATRYGIPWSQLQNPSALIRGWHRASVSNGILLVDVDLGATLPCENLFTVECVQGERSVNGPWMLAAEMEAEARVRMAGSVIFWGLCGGREILKREHVDKQKDT